MKFSLKKESSSNTNIELNIISFNFCKATISVPAHVEMDVEIKNLIDEDVAKKVIASKILDVLNMLGHDTSKNKIEYKKFQICRNDEGNDFENFVLIYCIV